MIRIARGEEPAALRGERRRRRALCRLIDLGVRAGVMVLDEGYQVAAEALFCAQGPVCAYCENHICESGVPLDHFRPKGAVYDEARKLLHGGYWWLTWSWENLLRACGTCNDAQHKGNRFPVVDEAARLASMCAPPGDERALLIDPTREDPMDLIEYRTQGSDVDGAPQWKPLPRRGLDQANTRRAIETIRVLRLDEGALLDFYNLHVAGLAAHIERVQEAIAASNAAEVARRWNMLCGLAFGRRARFKALAWDCLRQTFDDALRARWALELPRPGAPLCPQASLEAPRLEGLDEVTCLEVEALGQRSPDETAIRDLLVRVLGASPRRCDELAAFFCRAEATLAAHLSALQSAQRVVSVGVHWCVPSPSEDPR